MTFKKFKLQKKKKIENEKQLPKIRDLKVPQTHINRSLIDTVVILLHTKQNTGLRKILDLPQSVIDKNIYILTSKVLEISLKDNYSNDLCFKILKKLVRNELNVYLHDLLFKYLEVSILSNRNYKKLFFTCKENCCDIIVNNKERLLEIVEDNDIKQKINGLKSRINKCTIKDKIIFVNGEFITAYDNITK